MITSDDLIFISTLAGQRSLAAAARALHVSPPSVSQRLAGLEARLGIRLIERTGRAGIMLTADCEHLVERAGVILAELEALSAEIAQARGEVLGHIRVIAPFGFGREHVAPAVTTFMASFPQMTAELTLSDQMMRLPEHPWDLIIRVGPLATSNLIAIPIAQNERLLCASQSYLDEYGHPSHPDDLVKHRCLAIREDDEQVAHWHFAENDEEKALSIRIKPYLASNDGEVVRNWALAGLGIVQRSEWSVSDDLRSGRLVRVLPNFVMPSAPVVALVSNRTSRAARVQVFLDHLRKCLKPAPWSTV